MWSLAGTIALGVVLMLGARFILRSPFFHAHREAEGSQPVPENR